MTDTAQATATVTITLSRDDALWWRNVIDEPHTWGNPGEAQRVLSAVVAALTAAPLPAPSDDERLEELAQRFGQVSHEWGSINPPRSLTPVSKKERQEIRNRVTETWDAFHAALAAGRSAEEGT